VTAEVKELPADWLKFDVVIGNPPYQDDAVGNRNLDTAIYHKFMDSAYECGKRVTLITPARFLQNAGSTPESWNKKMLADQHLKVAKFVQDSAAIFPGTDIKGGIAITYRDELNLESRLAILLVTPNFNQHCER
jgi:hypothetical protein